MMYKSQMAVAVKSKGKVLRESGSPGEQAVHIPFGSEYTILVKNLNSVRALVKIWIDGTDVTDGTSGIIVEPNKSIELERSIKNGNMTEGNRFKFIERTAAVSNHRGNKVDDGLIRVEFEYERPQPVYNTQLLRGMVYSKGLGDIAGSQSATFGSRETFTSANASGGMANVMDCQADVSASMDWMIFEQERSVPANDVGITVPGSVSTQQFSVGDWFPTDGVKHTMVIQVLGEVAGQPVTEPITVAHKPRCSVCGTSNKATAKFCGECGAGLQIV